MDWQTLTWQPVDGPALAGATPLAPHAPVIQSALEEAVSAAILGSATLAKVETAVVEQPAELAGEFVPLASFEFLGASRRGTWVALDTSAGESLGGQALTALDLGQVVLEALDSVLSELLGEGLNIRAANTAPEFPDASLLVIRLGLQAADGSSMGLVVGADAAVPSELGAHVVALQILSGESVPAATSTPAGGPPAGDAPAFAPATAAAPAPPRAAAAQQKPAAAPQPAVAVHPAAFEELGPGGSTNGNGRHNIDLLLGVSLEVSVEIGRTHLPIRDILALSPGSIVELDKLAGEPVNVLVNGRTIASGEVVVVDENFGVRITSITSRTRRITSAGGPA